ncbi:Uncharacterised protein [Actinomyces howellii]|uniref:DUF4230 domain-containing protein n=1 Tax=Actinomyces howellii TaxID=52771 RepID=A0A448HG40_9ACTO|nr:Uncharacterised protein [Actinomyces howellii]
MLLVGGGFSAGVMYADWGDPEVTAQGIEQQISTCSELTTVKLTETGIVHYEDGMIPLIDKTTFNMVYKADVRVGVDLSEVDVSVDGKVITVALPRASVQEVGIDPASISLYDKSFTLVDGASEEDLATAIADAEADVAKNLDDDTLIETADQQAQDVITGLLSPLTDAAQGYTIEFVVEDSAPGQ